MAAGLLHLAAGQFGLNKRYRPLPPLPQVPRLSAYNTNKTHLPRPHVLSTVVVGFSPEPPSIPPKRSFRPGRNRNRSWDTAFSGARAMLSCCMYNKEDRRSFKDTNCALSNTYSHRHNSVLNHRPTWCIFRSKGVGLIPLETHPRPLYPPMCIDREYGLIPITFNDIRDIQRSMFGGAALASDLRTNSDFSTQHPHEGMISCVTKTIKGRTNRPVGKSKIGNCYLFTIQLEIGRTPLHRNRKICDDGISCNDIDLKDDHTFRRIMAFLEATSSNQWGLTNNEPPNNGTSQRTSLPEVGAKGRCWERPVIKYRKTVS
ncbi:hypothetical protein J6590_059963 [Homalodisca vitripennis]|nr:hypothetical protein J6590_059963 [Homalodisca vitripennis]